MKKLLPLFVIAPLVFTSCEKKPEAQTGSSSDTSTSAPTSNSNTSFNSALTNVVSHLETNGSHFSITHIDDDINQLAKSVDGLIDIARASSQDIPPNLNIVKLLKGLGLSKIDAIGRSSRANQDMWHNRLFLQTNGDRSGLLSIMGEEGSKWRCADIAPADADLVMEFELNLRRLRETMKVVSDSFGEQAEASISAMMKEKIAGGALSLGDMLGKTDLRAKIVVSLDREKRWKATEQTELPTMHAALCIERGTWLWKQFGEEIEKDSTIGERNGLKTVKAPEEMVTPMGKLRPIIAIDEAKDLLWFSLSEEYLDTCLSKQNTLASSDDFKRATTGFPEKGNGFAYASGDFYQEVIQQLKQVGDNLPENSEQASLFEGINRLLGLSQGNATSPHGFAWCLSNTKSGILCVGNSLLPDKGYGLMTSVAPIAAIAGMSTPAILKQKTKAEQVRAISNAKQLYLALLDYESEEGEFPEKLSDLVEDGYLEEATFAVLINYTVNGKVHEFVYIPSLSTRMDGNMIILHSPAPIDGKYLILRIDGAAQMIPAADFENLMRKQKSAE